MISWLIAVVAAAALVAFPSATPVNCPCYTYFQDSTYVICNSTTVGTIPDCVPDNITHISIRTPSIALVPKSIRRFTALRRLDIEYFEHPRISKVFLGGQKHLKYFMIHATSLGYVDKDWFKYAPNIETLHFTNNKITHFDPDTFQYVPNLKTLSIDGNQLSTLPPTVFAFTKLKNLWYGRNPWHCDCGLSKAMEWVVEKNVTLEDQAYCSYPMQLEGMKLSHVSSDIACLY